MTPTANYPIRVVLHQIVADLANFPGRFAMAWRVGALCALMALVAMVYQIPESAISCYLILFVMKPDKMISMVMAIAIIILVSIIIALMILFLPYTLGYPPIRMLVLVSSSFLFLWLGSASKLGPVGSIIALVIAFIMSLLGEMPNGELASRAILYAWLMATSPMFLLIGFNLVAGRSSWTLLCNSLSERLAVAAETLRQPDEEHLATLQQLLLEGQQEHQQRIMLVKLFSLRSREQMQWMEAAITSSYRVLLATAAQSTSLPQATRYALADSCQRAADALRNARADQEALPAGDTEIHAALRALRLPESDAIPKAPKSSFMAADAFTNPVHVGFALKTTAASVICYFVYTILDWQDIHTAMVTCYVAVLGTTGETIHKLALRITGCLIGATIGIFSLIYIVPLTDDIGQLMILVFLTLTLAAWVSCGNERISYGGIQIGLAFLLTVLHGYSPSSDLDVAFDRIAGILLGNFVIYLMFTLVSPVPIIDSVRTRTNDAVKALARLAALPVTARSQRTLEASQVQESAAEAGELLKLVFFEPVSLRASQVENQRLRAVLTEVKSLCPVLFLPEPLPQSDVDRLSELSVKADSPALDHLSVPETTAVQNENGATVHQRIRRLKELLG